MSRAETVGPMSEEGRALLTDREREILAGEADVTDNYRYKVRSTVRRRIEERFADDVTLLREEFPEVVELLAGALEERDDTAEKES